MGNKTMGNKTMGNRIQQVTIVAAFLFTVAGTFPVAAEETTDSTYDTEAVASIQATNAELAKEANEDALDDAVKSILENNRLDLDIRLLDHNSETVAARD